MLALNLPLVGVWVRRFRLRDASVDGDGLHAELRDTGWESIRALAYEGRGG